MNGPPTTSCTYWVNSACSSGLPERRKREGRDRAGPDGRVAMVPNLMCRPRRCGGGRWGGRGRRWTRGGRRPLRTSMMRPTVVGPRPGTRSSSIRSARLTSIGNRSGWRLAHRALGSVESERLPPASRGISSASNPYLRSSQSAWYRRCSRAGGPRVVHPVVRRTARGRQGRAGRR